MPVFSWNRLEYDTPSTGTRYNWQLFPVVFSSPQENFHNINNIKRCKRSSSLDGFVIYSSVDDVYVRLLCEAALDRLSCFKEINFHTTPMTTIIAEFRWQTLDALIKYKHSYLIIHSCDTQPKTISYSVCIRIITHMSAHLFFSSTNFHCAQNSNNKTYTRTIDDTYDCLISFTWHS